MESWEQPISQVELVSLLTYLVVHDIDSHFLVRYIIYLVNTWVLHSHYHAYMYGVTSPLHLFLWNHLITTSLQPFIKMFSIEMLKTWTGRCMGTEIMSAFDVLLRLLFKQAICTLSTLHYVCTLSLHTWCLRGTISCIDQEISCSDRSSWPFEQLLCTWLCKVWYQDLI